MVVELFLAGLATTTLVVVGVAIVRLLRTGPATRIVDLTETPRPPGPRAGRRT